MPAMSLAGRNILSGLILPASFYARPTLRVARSLIGKYLVRETTAGLRAGRIIEVEAYVGFHDRASHASRGRTKRTEVMFGRPGLAYVYLIYGMHHCLNVVTERADFPAAVLIRAVEDEAELIDGPGRVCRSFKIDREFNLPSNRRGLCGCVGRQTLAVPSSIVTAAKKNGAGFCILSPLISLVNAPNLDIGGSLC
jgi:DNA-3-methyladenine glycosylase